MQRWRQDIDGMRAVAVIAVVLFHARLGLFSGGFVGVDIFFVISGFLITGLVLDYQGTFSEFLASFYERRVRRLFPPIIPVVAATSAAAAWLLLPAALEEYSKSLISFLLLGANWFFLSISGYFDGPAHLKPLLHTWSLSIEEQFYLLFPLPIIFLRKCGKYRVGIGLAAVFICSFGFNLYLIHQGDSRGAFFNSFGRFWEIAVGAVLATGIVPTVRHGTVKHALGLLGLVCILYAITAYNSETVFPGYAALVPTIGTALVIHVNGGIVSRVLSLRPIVFIGTVSYGLYLWHWPILVFLGIYFGQPSKLVMALGLAAAFALATLSFFLLERPVRARSALSTRHAAYLLLIVGSLPFVLFGAAGITTAGWPGRFTGLSLLYTPKRGMAFVGGKACELNVVDGACVIGDHSVVPRFALIGDSHAATLSSALSDVLSRHHQSAYLYVMLGCPFIEGVLRYTYPRDCKSFVESVFIALKRHDITNVIINDYRNAYLTGTSGIYPTSTRELQVYSVAAGKESPHRLKKVLQLQNDTISRLTSSGIHVYFVATVPDGSASVPEEVRRRVERGGLPFNFDLSAYLERSKPLFSTFSRFSADPLFTPIYPHEAFCDTAKNLCFTYSHGRLYYTDDNHLSVDGAKILGGLIERSLFPEERPGTKVVR